MKAHRQISQLKLTKREWRPYKATKIDVLDFIHLKEAVTIHDLMERFNYTYYGASKRLGLLHREKLIVPLFQRGTWGITELAAKKLDYYNRL